MNIQITIYAVFLTTWPNDKYRNDPVPAWWVRTRFVKAFRTFPEAQAYARARNEYEPKNIKPWATIRKFSVHWIKLD